MHHVHSDFVRGVNTLEEPAYAESLLYQRIRSKWMQRGVRISDPSSVLIEHSVRIGRGSIIGRGVHLQGSTTLGKQVCIGPYSILENTQLADNAVVYSHL